MTEAEKTRDRILKQLTEILEESDRHGGFQAPEVRIPLLCSALYAMMLQEFAECEFRAVSRMLVKLLAPPPQICVDVSQNLVRAERLRALKKS
jgi:hypothetical protein